MKRILALLLVMALAVGIFAGCSPKDATEPTDDSSVTDAGTDSTDDGGQAVNDDAIVLKLNHVSNEKGVYQGAALKFKEEVEARTDGAVTVEIYTDAQLGNERDMVESLQMGTLDIGFIASSVLTSFVPEYALLDVPFSIQDEEHAAKVVDGKVGTYLSDLLLSGQNIRTLGYYQNGYRHIFSTKPIDTIEDFSGLKIRTMETEIHQAAFSALGAMPTPMAFGEVFTALQQGTIDAAENSLDNIYSQNFHEVAKHVTLSGHVFGFVVLCISEKSWEKIPEEYHEAIQEAGKISAEYEAELMKTSNDEAQAKLEEAGVTIHEIDRTVLEEACSGLKEQFSDVLPEEYMTEIENLKA